MPYPWAEALCYNTYVWYFFNSGERFFIHVLAEP